MKINWVVEIYGPSPWMWRLRFVLLHLTDFLIWRAVISPCCEIFFILFSFYLSLSRDFQEFFFVLPISIVTLVFNIFLCLIQRDPISACNLCLLSPCRHLSTCPWSSQLTTPSLGLVFVKVYFKDKDHLGL